MDDGFHPVAFRWRRQNHVTGTSPDVSSKLLSSGEGAGALKHDVHAHWLPWQPPRITLMEQPHLVLNNLQMPIVGRLNRFLVATVDRVVSQEVLDTFGRANVIGRDEV